MRDPPSRSRRTGRASAALDFGWDHPTAAVRLAWDRDADIVYVTDAYRVREETPLMHAAALNAVGRLDPGRVAA